ncbi:hypothetical protein JTL76_38345, partial [Pseudomonas aeruginosa]|nr:hypothetical protein [Pseudomonas aeruginosa]
MSTWVSFRSAEQPLLGQFSVSGNIHYHRSLFRSREVVVERLSMRKIREVLRLKFDCGLSVRKIAR